MFMNHNAWEQFRVLVYVTHDGSMRSVKSELEPFGYYDTTVIRKRKNIQQALEHSDPQTVIVVYKNKEEEETLSFLEELRQTYDCPVILWGDKPGERLQSALQSFRNTYSLIYREGVNPLIQVLQRIKMKMQNPLLWI
jgi:hypothetical protein